MVLTQDEALVQRLAAGLAATPDYRLLPAGRDVSDAQRYSAEGGVHLVLVDWRLQPDDTPALVRSLIERFPGVPVALLADPQDTDLIRRALMAGAKSFLPVEFAPESLVQMVEDLTSLNGSRPGSAGGQTGRVVVVFSLKGGVGRTLLATNLAVALRRWTSGAVALVDGQIALWRHRGRPEPAAAAHHRRPDRSGGSPRAEPGGGGPGAPRLRHPRPRRLHRPPRPSAWSRAT